MRAQQGVLQREVEALRAGASTAAAGAGGSTKEKEQEQK